MRCSKRLTCCLVVCLLRAKRASVRRDGALAAMSRVGLQVGHAHGCCCTARPGARSQNVSPVGAATKAATSTDQSSPDLHATAIGVRNQSIQVHLPRVETCTKEPCMASMPATYHCVAGTHSEAHGKLLVMDTREGAKEMCSKQTHQAGASLPAMVVETKGPVAQWAPCTFPLAPRCSSHTSCRQ